MAEKLKPTKTVFATKRYEKALTSGVKEHYVLRLYITGMTPRSQEALRKLKKVCHEYLGDNYELEVIDIYQQPILGKGDQIIAVPTLIMTEVRTPVIITPAARGTSTRKRATVFAMPMP